MREEEMVHARQEQTPAVDAPSSAITVPEYHAMRRRVLATAEVCDHCGEDFSDDYWPNIEAFELSLEIVCDECAETIFEDNGQFGVGA